MAAKKPLQATIFSYRVGFGDCFLLRFTYKRGEQRHLLIDFGTTGIPEDAEKDLMVRVAQDIAERSGGRLDVIVATHRHADHISGFATKEDGSGSGDIIAGLSVGAVIQPWTEAPDEAEASLGPEIDAAGRSMAARRRSLADMQALAARLVELMGEEGSLKGVSTDVRRQLDFLGRDAVKNLPAVENLMRIGQRSRAIYAYHGLDLGLDDLLPGVATHVLGPPTLRQTETIRKQRSRDPDEYWHFALKGLELDRDYALTDEKTRLFPEHDYFRASKLPIEARWIAERLDRGRGEQYLSIVTALDKALNNTSLILLFEAGGKKLLFPGDAQIENWRYALSQPEIVALLKDVDLYKVGHHGSLNATPRTMWTAFSKRGGEDKSERLTTLLSTMPGKHGSDARSTEVPRRTLLNELRKESNLFSTDEMPAGQLFQEVTIGL